MYAKTQAHSCSQSVTCFAEYKNNEKFCGELKSNPLPFFLLQSKGIRFLRREATVMPVRNLSITEGCHKIQMNFCPTMIYSHYIPAFDIFLSGRLLNNSL